MGDITLRVELGGKSPDRHESQDPKADSDAAAAMRAVMEQRRGFPGASILGGSLGRPRPLNIGSSTLGRDA